MAAFAAAHGKEDQAWKKLYAVYFGEQNDIFSLDALIEIGVSLGFEAEEVRDALVSGRYGEQVRREAEGSRGGRVRIDRRQLGHRRLASGRGGACLVAHVPTIAPCTSTD